MTDFTPWTSTLGGMLIGFSAALLLWRLGRIAGVSGILGGMLGARAGDVAWRVSFLGGLAAGGLVTNWIAPGLFAVDGRRSLLTIAVAGLLVGVGTRMGSGCTSGHGVCGVSRGSPRSLVATATFMATGALTVFVVRHVFGGTP